MASRGRGSFTEVHLCGGAMRRSLIQQVNASHQRASKKGRICMRNLKVALSMASLGFVLAATAVLATPGPAGAIIHEMVGANCSFNGPPEPPGQAGASNGQSFVRALQSTGVISSIVSTPTNVTVNFDLSAPPAKYVSAGFALTIPDGFGPGVSLTLNPLPVLAGSNFPAFVHCANLNPKP